MRVLATVTLTGAALSFSGVAQAEGSEVPPPVSTPHLSAADEIVDALADGVIAVFNKQKG